MSQITTRKDDFYSKWRKDIVDTISRFKVFDNRFREHITLEKFEIRERYISGTEIESQSTEMRWSGNFDETLLFYENMPKLIHFRVIENKICKRFRTAYGMDDLFNETNAVP